MSSLVHRLKITAPPGLEKSLGYAEKQRWVAWHWQPDMNEAIAYDGKRFNGANTAAWQVFVHHEGWDSNLQSYQLTHRDRYWLLLDRTTRNLYIGEADAVQQLLTQPESLGLLARLDKTQQTPLPSRWAANLMLVGMGILAIASAGFGSWFILKTIQPARISPLKVAPTILGDRTCGVGGSGDFSAYTMSHPGGKELHLIGVYEARDDHSGNHHPTGNVTVKVDRENVPITLVLSSYEPVQWQIQRAPGTTIEQIILKGYHDQSIVGAEGILVTELSYEGTGASVELLDSQWRPENTAVIQQLEHQTGAGFTSFQGCYRATNFNLK